MLNTLNVYRHFLSMQFFGSKSAKGTWLYSNKHWIKDIDLFKSNSNCSTSHKLTDCRPDSNGDLEHYGNKDALKESQSYTSEFGAAYAKLLAFHKSDILADTRAAAQHAEDFLQKAGGAIAIPTLACNRRSLWADANILRF